MSKDEKARNLRERIAESTFKAGHHTTIQHPTFQFVLKKVSRQFLKEVRQVKSDQDHLVLLVRLLARLEDGHASVRPLAKGKSVKFVAPLRNICLLPWWNSWPRSLAV